MLYNNHNNISVYGSIISSIDNLIVIGSGKRRQLGDNKIEIQMESAIDPDTLGSSFASHLTKILVDCKDDIFICYDLTWSDVDAWLSKLRNVGFAVSTQPYHGTGRKLAVCIGKGSHLSDIDWLAPVWSSDSTFLAACPKGCGKLEHKVKTHGITDIYYLAVKEPEKLWELLWNAGLFAFIGGDEGDLFVVRMREKDKSLIIEALIKASKELDFSLYDAGNVAGWDISSLLSTTELPKDNGWCEIPAHWHCIVQ